MMPLIGKGEFSKVYRKTKKLVHIVSVDPVKEAISLGWCSKGHMIPKLTRIRTGIYTGIYYPKVASLKRSLKPLHYKRYQALRKLNKFFSFNNGTNFWIQKFKTLKDPYLRAVMSEFMYGLSNYSTNICFEISPRNVAVSPTGGLILLDVFFEINALEKIRESKQ